MSERPPSIINAEDTEESRELRAEKVLTFLRKIHAYEFFQSLLQDQKDLGKGPDIPFKDFEDLLVRINGILRNTPLREKGFDGDGVMLAGVDATLMPKHEDKVALLEYAYKQAVQVKHEGDEKYLLPAAVNAVHLFGDGNGRTSRILHVLLTPYASSEAFEKELRTVLTLDGRDVVDVSPGIVNLAVERVVGSRHGARFDGPGWKPVFEGPHGIAAAEKPTIEIAQEFRNLYKVDGWYGFLAAREVLREKGILDNVTSTYRDNILLSPLKMEKELSREDWDKVLDRYYAFKREHVRVIVDSFVDPDEYLSLEGTETLRDYFVREVEERRVNVNEADTTNTEIVLKPKE